MDGVAKLGELLLIDRLTPFPCGWAVPAVRGAQKRMYWQDHQRRLSGRKKRLPKPRSTIGKPGRRVAGGTPHRETTEKPSRQEGAANRGHDRQTMGCPANGNRFHRHFELLCRSRRWFLVGPGEDRDITACRQIDPPAVLAAFFAVIGYQGFPDFVGLNPDDRVLLRIEIGAPCVDIDADRVLVYFVSLSG